MPRVNLAIAEAIYRWEKKFRGSSVPDRCYPATGGAAGCFNRLDPILAAGVQVADVQPQSLEHSRVFHGSVSLVPGSSSAHTGFHAHLCPIPRR